jgi:hypothetical protein
VSEFRSSSASLQFGADIHADEQKAGDEQLHYGNDPVGPGPSKENPAGVSETGPQILNPILNPYEHR